MKALKTLLTNQKKARMSFSREGITFFHHFMSRWHGDAFSCSISPTQCDIAPLAHAVGMGQGYPVVAFETNHITVNGVRLPLSDGDALPWEDAPEDFYHLEAHTFKAAKFCSKEDCVLGNVYVSEGQVIGSDGHRFSKYPSSYQGPKGMIPQKAAVLAERLARASKISMIQVAFPTPYTWFVRVGNIDLQGQLYTQKYVNIERVLADLGGDASALGFKIDPKAWKTAVEPHKNVWKTHVHPSHDKESIVFTSDICQMVVPYAGEDFPHLMFNTKYLLEALRLKPSVLYAKDSDTPVLFVIDKGLHGLMPLCK